MIQILLISSLVVLGACSIVPKTTPVEVNTVAIPAPMFHPPLPRELSLLDVKYEILTPEIMQEYLELVKKGEAPAIPYYALNTQNYENLSNNMAEIIRYAKDIRALVEYYRTYGKTDED